MALPTPFLDISDLVLPEAGERRAAVDCVPAGLRRPASRFYVYFTDNGAGRTSASREFRRYAGAADHAEARSRRVVLDESSHPVDGEPQRRPACSSGRTATCTRRRATAAADVDPRTTAQDLGSLHGKILRIDPRPAG